jgi:hypothetical protein
MNIQQKSRTPGGSLRGLALPAFLVLATGTGTLAQTAGWLDGPMTRWNEPGLEMPAAPGAAETRDAFSGRCKLSPPDGPREGATAKSAHDGGAVNAAMVTAGWMPFLHFDRAIVRDDIEIIGGMSAATPSCDPAGFNLFVFVGGRFAGTLSPIVMTSRRDGAVGAVRITGADAVTAEFAHYVSTDPDCCPSSHVRVTYRIDRTGVRPVVVAVEARQVRG